MSKENEVVFYTDGRHSSVYLYEPPMGVRQYVEPIDELLDLGIDTITYAVGDCSVLLYATEVGERWGHNVDLTDHTIWYRAGQNAQSLIERGMDPLRLVCEHAQKRGFSFMPHLLLNMIHTPHDRVTNCRVADFTTEHPEWQVGPEPDYPEAMDDIAGRLSYAVPEVRANRLAVIRELVSRYPTDGIEINFFDYAPFIARREVTVHTQTMTDWVREIRKVCDEAAVAQKRPKRLMVRIAGTLEGTKAMGMDLETWIREEIVATVIAMPVTEGFGEYTSSLQDVATAARGTKVTVLAGMGETHTRTREMYYAAAVNAYHAGAQGVLFHTYYPLPNMYPYDDKTIGTIRFMGYPEILAHKDKCFRVGIAPKPNALPKYGVPWQLPAPLTPGQPSPEITLEVGDDVAAKAASGELWRCELRVMLRYLMYNDKIRLVWNGMEIPETAQRKADWTYQLRPRPSYGVEGYRIHVNLDGDWLPKVGKNTIRIDVLTKNERLIHPITIADVELAVEYLPHRHGLRSEERW